MTSHERPTTPFLDRLGDHLYNAFPPARPQPRRAALLAGAAFFVIASVSAAILLWPQSSTVEAFAIIETDGLVIVEVAKPIEDPAAAIDQLGEFNIAAAFEPVPVAPELVGFIVALEANSGDATVTFDAGRVIAFVAEPGGSLTINFGRQAEPGEVFAATLDSTTCDEWIGRTVAKAGSSLSATFDQVRWQLFDNGIIEPIDQPNPNHFIQDIVVVSAADSVVIVSPLRGALPSNNQCD